MPWGLFYGSGFGGDFITDTGRGALFSDWLGKKIHHLEVWRLGVTLRDILLLLHPVDQVIAVIQFKRNLCKMLKLSLSIARRKEVIGGGARMGGNQKPVQQKKSLIDFLEPGPEVFSSVLKQFVFVGV